MTPPDSPTGRPLGTLLGDAQALVATATAEALHAAGSTRELRLLERIASANAADGHRTHHMRRRLDIKVAQPGTIAATFAARGWLTSTDQAWRLTPAGDAERARLTAIVASAVGDTTENSELAEALTTAIDSLGGPDAARTARRAQRRPMRERMGMRGNDSMRTGCGHPHSRHHRNGGHGAHGGHGRGYGHGRDPHGHGHGHDGHGHADDGHTGPGGRGCAHGPHAHGHAEHDGHAGHAGHGNHDNHGEYAGHGGHGEHGHTCEGNPRGRGFGRRHGRPHDFDSTSTDTER
ncbi:hypothetical protein [Microbacterium sp. NC79]|uniref:hypothetical protein n=1 Tax=Microbacterium sp. NC79 TaxID=2851009 RepID=UPI001C2C27C2|nr:hypothetical protein [Microbacterium sp. NC79]MBV0895891.1 hypothetical protein [Microbacterium sp. NC79]